LRLEPKPTSDIPEAALVECSRFSSHPEVQEEEKATTRERIASNVNHHPQPGIDLVNASRDELGAIEASVSVVPGDPFMHTAKNVGYEEVETEGQREGDFGGGKSHESEVSTDVQATVCSLKELIELATLL
jgi:hypothetical protein